VELLTMADYSEWADDAPNASYAPVASYEPEYVDQGPFEAYDPRIAEFEQKHREFAQRQADEAKRREMAHAERQAELQRARELLAEEEGAREADAMLAERKQQKAQGFQPVIMIMPGGAPRPTLSADAAARELDALGARHDRIMRGGSDEDAAVRELAALQAKHDSVMRGR
jgi:sRNA-binding protein